MMIHDVKCKATFFQQLIDGHKPFEFRNNDRGYKTGDYVFMREVDPEYEIIGTGRTVLLKITYVLTHDDFEQMPEGYCIFSFLVLGTNSREKETPRSN